MDLFRFRGALAAMAATAVLLLAPAGFAQNEGQTHGRAVITVLPDKGSQTAANLSQQDLQVKVNGKDATITNVMPLRDNNDHLEVVLMLDAGARTSMANQFGDIRNFINGLPQGAKASLAYMEYGTAHLVSPLTTDRQAVLNGLKIPSGMPGENASAYICLSDLAKHWPSNDPTARRIVVMVSDGVDYYDPHFDPQDPYMEASITDSIRANLVVYSIYWQNRGRFDSTAYASFSGQNLLQQVTQATGGNSYWQGTGNPVSFQPYFKDIDKRLQNQFEIGITAPVNKAGVGSMKVKLSNTSSKLDAPQQIYLGHADKPVGPAM
jgi:hypothetical protein